MTDSCESVESVQSQFNWSTKSPSIAVVEAIAAIENIEPENLPLTLYEYVNPESLDTLVRSNDNISVSFFIDEYQVQIDEQTLSVTLR